MSTVIDVLAVSEHGNVDSNRKGSKTANKSKTYPESVHPEERRGKNLKDLFKQHLKEIVVIIFAIVIIGAVLVSITIYYVVSEQRHPHLVYSNMIWRHGDRAPVHYFPNFTENYMIAFPRGLGNLTKIGAEQAESLGASLRKRYLDSNIIASEKIYIRSTDVHRTIATAKYVLKGMNLSDVPVHVEATTDVDTAGNPFFYCPRAKQFVDSNEEKSFLRENFGEVYEIIERELNYNNYTYIVFDTINCLRAHDLKLPDWMDDDELYEKLKFLSWYGVTAQFGLETFDNELQRKIRGGSVLRAVVSRIACKLNYQGWEPVKACEENFYGLSAHDMTLAALLSTFNNIHSILGELPKIEYGANIAFEIWQIGKSYKLRIIYANEWKETPRDITRFAPGCGDADDFCDAIKFIDQSRLLFSDDVHAECMNNGTDLDLHEKIRRSVHEGRQNAPEMANLIDLY